MDPFELVLFLSIVVVLPITLLKLILDYKRDRLASTEAGREGAAALTLGELKDIMRQIAEETAAPLARRLDAMESRSTGDVFADHAPLREEPGIRGVPSERTLGRRTT